MVNTQPFEIGFSPCPNDTFIFDAFVHQKLNTDSLFNYVLKDVEELNRMAAFAQLDITKLSFSAYAFVSKHYQILSAGSALGNKCGPLIISKKPLILSDLKDCKVAIPGKYTTANLLMSIFVPECKEKLEMLFSDIEQAVLDGSCDAGLIIHENRFTYPQKGLLKVADMGELWESKKNLPIPLGCIAIRRSLPEAVKSSIAQLIRQSVEYAFNNPTSSRDFVSQNAQELSPTVQQQHIDLYVNKFSIDLGKEGEFAVRELLAEGRKCGLLPELTEPIFIESGNL